MANGTNLANAYVQIIPTTEGIKGKLTDLMKGEAESSGEASGKSFASKMMKTIGGLGIGLAVAKGIKDTIDESASIEQSIGGIETLFKDSADQVIKYSDNAWKTSGLSANEYMETATSFSASLLQGLSGDTEKASKITDMAITDMSDNANKMGTDMSQIQSAYQGFAKGQYQLLDNLKLGYGGTKGEMERLLKDAEEFSGVEYDIDNLADVYEAIHVIQTELDITGTTSKEASSTLSGSFSAMQSAWKNVLGNLGSGREQLGDSLKALVESASTYLFGNLMPTIANIISGVPKVIATLVTEGVPMFIKSGKDIITGMIGGINGSIPDTIRSVGDVVANMLQTILENLPKYMEKGYEMMTKLIDGIKQNLPSIMSAVGEVLLKIIATIGQNLPQILEKGLEIVGKIASGIVQGIPTLISQLPQIFNRIKTSLAQYDWRSIGRQIVQGIINGLNSMLSDIGNAVGNIGSSALASIKTKLGIHSPSRVFENEVGKMIALGMANGISNNADAVRNAMGRLTDESVGTVNVETSYRGSTDFGGVAQNGTMLEQIFGLLNTYLPQEREQNIVLDSGALVGGIVSQMDRQLGSIYTAKNRGGALW